jgi:hypothetical protein
MLPVEMAYEDARPLMQPGDVIAFGGHNWVSGIIKWATRSPVSHLGVILQTRALHDKNTTRFFNLVVESTQWENFIGVDDARLSDRLEGYRGDAWWLPLSQGTRQNFNEAAFFDFLYSVKNRSFDLPQAIQAAFDFAEREHHGQIKESFQNQEDLSRFYCSELVAAAFRAAGVVGNINASEVTPVDLCCWKLFQLDYYSLKKADPAKKPLEITGYNSMDPGLWGVRADGPAPTPSQANQARMPCAVITR